MDRYVPYKKKPPYISILESWFLESLIFEPTEFHSPWKETLRKEGKKE